MIIFIIKVIKLLSEYPKIIALLISIVLNKEIVAFKRLEPSNV